MIRNFRKLSDHTNVSVFAFIMVLRLHVATNSSTFGQEVRVRIELIDVECRDTEDITGADEFYIMGALEYDGRVRGVLTRPFDINDGQTKKFLEDDKIVFDAQIARGQSVTGGLAAFDEDVEKDWAKQKDMVKKIVDGVSSALDSSGDKDLRSASRIVKLAYEAVGVLAALDADDLLGRTEIKVPAEGPAEETKEWRFEHKDGIGFSSWEYTVRYRIFRSK